MFICNPDGKCDTDKFNGIYKSDKDYVYTDKNKKPEEKQKIPSKYLQPIKNEKQATYMFWLMIDQKAFSKMNNTDQYILKHGNNIVIHTSHIEPRISFTIFNNNNNIIDTTYPFGEWVHYCITINDRVVELYKNATLEQTMVLSNADNIVSNDIEITRTKNTATDTDIDKSYLLYNMSYLMFLNSVPNPEDIYKIYKNQYNMIAYKYDSDKCVECKNPSSDDTCT